MAEISDAYKLLTPVLGASFASTLFACALLASGQNSTLTGTLAGQIVMEGFLDLRLKPWLRRLITRGDCDYSGGARDWHLRRENKVTSLLILSQVVLSFQLPFAVIPLIQFTSDRAKDGGIRQFASDRGLRVGSCSGDNVFQRGTAVSDFPLGVAAWACTSACLCSSVWTSWPRNQRPVSVALKSCCRRIRRSDSSSTSISRRGFRRTITCAPARWPSAVCLANEPVPK